MADIVKVEQVDRDAAADLIEQYHSYREDMLAVAARIRKGHADHATHAIAFARHRQIPPGYVLVPVKLTTRMICAGSAAYEAADDDYKMTDTWKAMLSAAPSQTKEGGE